MYKPGIIFERTDEERRDLFLDWAREDQPFFAAGACHILADMFRQLHRNEEYETMFINPSNGEGTHVYVSDGTWAFDHNGWTLEKELIEITQLTYEKEFPGWTFEKIVVKEDLEMLCANNNHRPPWRYAHLPWERAYKYIQKFDSKPPSD